MRSGWQVGSIFGIPFFIDPSWGLILAFVTFSNSMHYLEAGLTTGVAWGAGLVMALLLFASVLLHELGHSLVAMAQGIKVNSITLFLFGGVAAIDRESNTPGQAFQVAIAGPLVSFLLFFLFNAAAGFLGDSVLAALTESLARINLVLALFNLIPGLPLDGGQVLKAALWKLTGNRLQAVQWAALGGQIVGGIGIGVGLLLLLLTGGSGSSIWLMVIAWFILRNATGYRRITSLQDALLRVTAADAMTRNFRVVEGNQTLHQFAETYLLQTAESAEKGLNQSIYYAASEGRYLGLVQIEDLQTIERSRWETATLHDVVHPLHAIPTVREPVPLAQVITLLEAKQMNAVTVLSPADAVAGVIDRGDIVRAVAKQLSSEVAEGVIQQIKQTGTYPTDLPLVNLARSVSPDLSSSEPQV